MFDSLRLESRGGDAGDAGHGQRRGIYRAEIDRLAEGEVIGVEVTRGWPLGKSLAAQHLQQRLLHVALEVIGVDADVSVDLQGNILRRIELQVLAGEPELRPHSSVTCFCRPLLRVRPRPVPPR